MADLLRRDKVLRRRFAHNRERRIVEIERFFGALAQRGLMRLPADPAAAALDRGHHMDNFGELAELRGVP